MRKHKFIKNLDLVSFCCQVQPELLLIHKWIKYTLSFKTHNWNELWANLINSISGCSMVEKKIHHLHILCSDRNVQWCLTILKRFEHKKESMSIPVSSSKCQFSILVVQCFLKEFGYKWIKLLSLRHDFAHFSSSISNDLISYHCSHQSIKCQLSIDQN